MGIGVNINILKNLVLKVLRPSSVSLRKDRGELDVGVFTHEPYSGGYVAVVKYWDYYPEHKE